MVHKLTLFASALLCILLLSTCKKNDSETSSPNEVIVSYNSYQEFHYNKGTYNQSTETNRAKEVGFSRTYYTTTDGRPNPYSIVQFEFIDDNVFAQPLPYKVKKCFAYLSLATWPFGNYSFDNRYDKNAKGHFDVIINYAKDQRIKGTYNGIVYNPYNFTHNEPDSLNIKGSFDILTPPYSDH